jgi:hypothetical protein
VTLSTPSIDDLFEQVKTHIALHRADTAAPEAIKRGGRFSETVYDRIEEAGVLADATFVQPVITPVHVPVVGELWQRVRRAAHNLTIFYVNRHAGAQTSFNREVVSGLREVVQELDEDGGTASALEIAALRSEIRLLQQRLAGLEKTLAGRSNGTE